MNKIIFLTLSILFINCSLTAQTKTTKFYLRDSSIQKGLPVVSFKIWKDSVHSNAFLSDHSGIVTVDDLNPGKYNIHLSYIGYHNLDTSVSINNNPQAFTFYLEPAGNRLKGISVTTNKPILEMKRGNFILHVQRSPLARSGNVWEALKYAPTVITDLSGKLSVKGQSTTVYIDGRRIRLSGGDLMRYLKGIPAANIEKIEVSSHPGARYPSDVRTVINITTSQLKYEGIKGTLTSNFALGRYPRYNEGVTFDLKKSILSAQIGYSYTNTKAKNNSMVERAGNTRLPWTIHQTTNTKRKSQRGYANIELDFNKNNKFVFYGEASPIDVYSKVYADNGAPDSNRITAKDQIYKAFYDVKKPTSSYALQAIYETKWDSTKQSLRFKSAYFINNRRGTINRYSKLFNDGNYTLNDSYYEDILPQKLNTFVAGIQYIRPFLKGDLVSGVRYSHTMLNDNNQTFMYPEDKTNKDLINSEKLKYGESNYGIYSSWERQAGKMYFQGGLRIEQNKVVANNVTYNLKDKFNLFTAFPNLLVQWSQNKKSSWIFTYKKSLTRPNYYQLNPYDRFSGNNSVEFRGNQSIKPEVDHTIDLTWTNNSNFSLSAGVQINKNFISTIVLKDSLNHYYEKYDNFQARVYYLNGYYSVSPFKFWQIQFDVQALYLDVTAYPGVKRGKLSPAGNISLSNSLLLPHNWQIELSTFYTTTVYDGYYKHIGHGNINFAIVKDWQKPKLSLSIGGSDILKTNITKVRAMYLLYNSRAYNDSRFFRIGLSWRFGKQSVKVKDIDKSSVIQKSRDRLKKDKL